MSTVAVYIPMPELVDLILPKSGVVGSPVGDKSGPFGEQVVIDYEGNRYGAVNMKTWADRVRIAAGRHERRYPTVARAVVPAEQVFVVGRFYELEAGPELVLDDAESGDAVCFWLGISDPEDLRAECQVTS
jgi:hypothetical protein